MMIVKTRFAVLALVLTPQLSQVLSADTLGTLANTFFEFPASGTVVCPQSPAECSGTATVPGTTSQLSYLFYGVSTYGALGGYASKHLARCGHELWVSP
jgi:hypothetical protein